MTRKPVYFFSHGGPDIMEKTTHPAYLKLQELGQEITQQVQPKAVVVLSGHWAGEPKAVEVNTAESQGLIYDFYGFPSHFYKFQYPNKGSPELAQRIVDLLGQSGIEANGVRRGLDHGVWASFMCAFNPESNPLNVPIVQVSLFDSDDPNAHYALGAALEPLRDEGVAIIVSGMSVHNLRDMWKAFSGLNKNQPLSYVVPFDEALKEAVEAEPEQRKEKMAALLKRSDARKAHPDFDHLLPVHVGAGAAGTDLGKRVWTLQEGSFAWGMFRFGEVAA